MRRIASFSIIAAIAMMASGCAQQGGYQRPTRLDVGRVVNVERVATSGGWGTGAVLGGTAGVLTGRGHSTESKVIRGALGALAGAAIQKGITAGDQEIHVMVQTRQGLTYNVKHDSQDMVPGDCVQVETRYNGDMRLYRASPTQCNF